jgi:hypothetical protein
MNCHEFEKLINDLACDNLMTVNQRAQAWAHKENCPRCAARLAEERLLTERLRLVASADAEQAPARVKSAVMAAFALAGTAPRVAAKPSTETINAQHNLEATDSLAFYKSRWLWAAAAAVLLFAAITTARLLTTQSSVQAPPNAPPVVANGSTTPQEPQQGLPDVPKDVKKPEDQRVAESPLPNDKQPITEKATDGMKNPQDVQAARHHKTQNAPQNLIAEAADNQNEVVTDYVPLTYLSTATALDSGLVVRVQVPRSTLISMGLPMNVESSRELVKADVVVGDDGVARAIRLVHDVTAKAESKQTK